MEIIEINDMQMRGKNISNNIAVGLFTFDRAFEQKREDKNTNKYNYNDERQGYNYKISGAKTSDTKLQLVSGRDKITNVYNSIKQSPKYPADFRPVRNGKHKYGVNNYELLDELRKVMPGEWKKVYHDGYDIDDRKISIHYFEHQKTGKVFDVKVKNDWSNR